jgi:hypothetical protein
MIDGNVLKTTPPFWSLAAEYTRSSGTTANNGHGAGSYFAPPGPARCGR